jgi:pimeloyl-ACP methyl ester carboxylesterase
MSSGHAAPTKRSVETPSGRISYIESGEGPVALFVHGVLLNGYLWRHQLSELSEIRRCIAVDLLAHGDTEISPEQDVSVTANAKMLVQLLDALRIDTVDLVGNDSGGGIAQIFASENPSRVRTLTLTDCDAHDNWPPDAFKPFLEMAAAGGLRDTLEAMLADKNLYRSPQALGPAYGVPKTSPMRRSRHTFGRSCVRGSARAIFSVSWLRSTAGTRWRQKVACANCALQLSSSGARTTSISTSSGPIGSRTRFPARVGALSSRTHGFSFLKNVQESSIRSCGCTGRADTHGRRIHASTSAPHRRGSLRQAR